MRPRVGGAVLLAAVLLAGLGLWRAHGGDPPSQAERAAGVYDSLRCPTCTAESIADSQAPLAASMRSTVRDQVAAGRSDDEIRAWFVDRYGPTVLLSPPVRGFSALVWLLPAAGVLAAVAWWAAGLRRRAGAGRSDGAGWSDGDQRTAPGGPGPTPPTGRRRTGAALAAACVLAVGGGGLVVAGTGAADDASARDPDGGSGALAPGPEGARPDAARSDAALRALQAAADRAPDDAGAWLALGRALDDRADLVAAESAYRSALRIQPDHPAARLRLAFVLVRTDRPTRATELLGALLADEPRSAEAVLLLGTVQRQQGDEAWRSTLRHFLGLDPDHPAAPGVREMLSGGDR